MNLIKLTLTSFLLTSLIACGGGSPDQETETPSLGDEPTTGGGTTGGGTTDGGATGGDGTGGTNLIENIRFGSGSGADFKNKSINFENGYSLLGTQQPITVSVIDPNNDNSIVAQNYTYKFSSACADATPQESKFLEDTIVNASGTAKVYYTNINCPADTITVSLINPDGTEKAQIESSVEVSVPKLGSGSGSDFVEGKISGDVSLPNNPASTILSLDAVDRHISAVNKIISSSDYIVKWSSECGASSFSVPEQTLTTAIETTYNANGCTAHTVTASLYTQKDLATAIDTATVAISIGSEAAIVETPKLGAGVGANFKAGELSLGAEYVLVGSRLDFTVNAVDTDASKALTKNNYQYTFESSCAAANASFASEVVASSTGQVSNTYFNHNCSGANTLTVRLFAADDLTRTTVLSTATATFDANTPKLGSGSGSAFISGLISGEVNLIDQTSTLLSINAVDTTNVNAVINSSDYILKWDADCNEAGFSVPQQSLSTSLAETRYDVNSCTASDTVTAFLYSKKDKNFQNPIDTTTVEISIGEAASIAEVPVLGTGNGANFKAGELSLDAEYVLVGSRLGFIVNTVNTDASNTPTKNNYQYTFESTSCTATSSFESEVVASSTGQVSNTYFNHNCSGANTLTVRLFAADDLTRTTVLSTATATFDAKLPTLGTGSGANFLEGNISGETNLVEVKSTELAINLVDTNDLNDINKLITSSDYLINWKSSCLPEEKFNAPKQSLSKSLAKTRYDAELCAADHTVTAILTSVKAPTVAIGVPATVDIKVVKTINETPKLGSLVGDSFNSEKLIIDDYYLIGSSFEFVVNSINSDKPNELTKKNYQYEFTTDCAGASFENAVVNSSAGLVNNKLLLKSNACAGEAKAVTVNLFAENGAGPSLATATATFDAITPKLGVGSGATYIDQKIDGELNLVDKTSTILNLNAVDPNSSNEKISSANYFVEWTVPDCPAGSFSVEKQSLFTSEVQTRYDHDTSCPASASDNLNVIATLYSKLAPADAITSIEQKLTIVAFNPDLGRESGAAFVANELKLGLASISAGGTSNITASIVDLDKSEELINSKNYAVKFTSECANLNPPKANFSAKDSVVITKTGNVETSYTAKGCSGNDLITATLHELVDGEANTAIELASATATITVAEPEFGTIAFVSNSNEIMTFTGIANSTMKSSSLVTFNVTDSANNPIENAEVEFSLSAQSASATASLSVETARTDADGNVSTTVRSGTSHGVLSVIAETKIVPDPVNNPSVTVTKRTSSLPISVTTGVAVQSNFSVSAEKFSVNSYGVDGVEIKINARLGDRYGNPVAEGTVVNFTAESGSVDTTKCITNNIGACEVTWRSQGDRPGQFSNTTAAVKNEENLPKVDGSGNVISPIEYVVQPAKGYTTITAYAIGEAGFLDQNANGIFDDDGIDHEPFETYPGVYRDDNYNNIFDDGLEEFFSIDGANTYPVAPTVYEGPLCSEAAEILGHCARSVYLTESIRILQSHMGDGYGVNFYKKTAPDTFEELTAANTNPDSTPAGTPFKVSSGDLYILVRDQNGNMPESGVQLGFKAEKFKDIEPKTTSGAKGLVLTTPGLPNRGFLHAITIYNDTAAVNEVGQLEVKITGGEGKSILNITP